MLMPAAVLIVVILGGISVDRAVIFGAQRDLVATAEAAANDAASLGVGVDGLRAHGRTQYDPARIDRAVAQAAGRADGEVSASWQLRGNVLVVQLRRQVRLVFTPGVPGSSDSQVITATATATLLDS